MPKQDATTYAWSIHYALILTTVILLFLVPIWLIGTPEPVAERFGFDTPGSNYIGIQWAGLMALGFLLFIFFFLLFSFSNLRASEKTKGQVYMEMMTAIFSIIVFILLCWIAIIVALANNSSPTWAWVFFGLFLAALIVLVILFVFLWQRSPSRLGVDCRVFYTAYKCNLPPKSSGGGGGGNDNDDDGNDNDPLTGTRVRRSVVGRNDSSNDFNQGALPWDIKVDWKNQ